jgi:hypothetical protein
LRLAIPSTKQASKPKGRGQASNHIISQAAWLCLIHLLGRRIIERRDVYTCDPRRAPISRSTTNDMFLTRLQNEASPRLVRDRRPRPAAVRQRSAGTLIFPAVDPGFLLSQERVPSIALVASLAIMNSPPRKARKITQATLAFQLTPKYPKRPKTGSPEPATRLTDAYLHLQAPRHND